MQRQGEEVEKRGGVKVADGVLLEMDGKGGMSEKRRKNEGREG